MSSQPTPAAVAVVPSEPGPLLVSANPVLADEIRRHAAAAGAVPLVVSSAAAARQPWAAAPVVLAGADLVADLTALRPPRRDGVVVVVGGEIEPGAWQAAVSVGAETVLSARDDRDRLVDLFGRSTDSHTEAPMLCVTGGCGGAGTSVFAAAVARAARERGWSTVLVDADPWGGGVDLLVGGEDVAGLRWPDLAATSGRVSAASLREVLPVVDGLAVLSWSRTEPEPVSAGSMRALLTAARRGHRLVVVDVPRREDEAALEALAMASSTVLVVPAEVRAVAAARVRLAMLRRATVRLAVVVRTAGGSDLDADDVAGTLELPLVAQMRPERGLAGWLDEGLGPPRRNRGPLARAAAATLDVCGPGDGAVPWVA